MIQTQNFLKTTNGKYAVYAALLFLYSSFSHEFFYLTPWFVLILICYYSIVLRVNKAIIKKSFIFVFLTLLALFILHLLLLRLTKHTYVSHFGTLERMSVYFYLEKPLKYLFHVFFLGRYFPLILRNNIYGICQRHTVILLFYGCVICWWGYIILRFSQLSRKVKLLALMSVYLLVVYLFLSPVYFADSLLVCYDRYVYPSVGLAGLFVVLLISFIPSRWGRVALIAVYAGINVWFVIKVNIYWKQSAYVIRRLLTDLPDPGNKTVLLLNLPDNMNGIPMIAAEEDGRFKMMKNTLTSLPVSTKIYDVEAYNMTAMEDGAHVMVINDSMLHVTLNQWGTWWIYGMLGAVSYQNNDYKVNMIDEGHWYELTLKHPAADYILLFQSGAQWKVVDWNKKNIDQQ